MTGRRVARLMILAGALVVGALAGTPPAVAHPLGDFTVNQYAGLRVTPAAVHVDYVVDMAELAAFQVRTESVDADHDATVSAVEGTRWAAAACTDVAGHLRLSVARRPAPLAVDASAVAFPAGAGGLPTLRLECTLRATGKLGSGGDIAFRNDAYPGRLGWREVTAVGDRVALSRSTVPAGSPSKRLTAYPEDLLGAPSDVRTATFTARPSRSAPGAGPAVDGAAPARPAVDRLTAVFTGVVGRRLTVGIALLGLVLAIVLGAAHALAPGHGKTVMAAVLVGERGSWRQAAVIAAGVTVTHTAGVLVLGTVVATSLTFAPQRLYSGLAATSGLLLAVVGVHLLRRALAARRHPAATGHHEHPHPRPRLRTLLTLGFAGGLLPSPSAVVVLLGAIALGRPWYGVLLVVAYGLGMAAALTGIGLVLSRWGRALSRRLTGDRPGRWRSALPVVTSTVVLLAGLGTAGQALLAH